jgi:hypothetical protein
MSSMEQVHQRAGEYEQIRKHAEEVGGVLGEQVEGGDGEEPDEHEAATGAPEAALTPRVIRVHDPSS